MTSLFQVGNCFVCSGNNVAMVSTLHANMMSPGEKSAVEMFTGGSLQIHGVPTREHCPVADVSLPEVTKHTEHMAVQLSGAATTVAVTAAPGDSATTVFAMMKQTLTSDARGGPVPSSS